MKPYSSGNIDHGLARLSPLRIAQSDLPCNFSPHIRPQLLLRCLVLLLKPPVILVSLPFYPYQVGFVYSRQRPFLLV